MLHVWLVKQDQVDAQVVVDLYSLEIVFEKWTVQTACQPNLPSNITLSKAFNLEVILYMGVHIDQCLAYALNYIAW